MDELLYAVYEYIPSNRSGASEEQIDRQGEGTPETTFFLFIGPETQIRQNYDIKSFLPKHIIYL
jgi:hypothetical protein